MSKATFFSNTLIYLDNAENEIKYSLAYTRIYDQRIFAVPEHNVNSNNLLIFLDGRIQIRGVHYEDINSFNVRFINNISPNREFYSILTKNGVEGTGGTTIELELKSNQF